MLARKIGLPVFERMLKMDDVYAANEVFLTGTAAEIIPVVAVDEREIGNGKPGKVTSRLLGEFRKLTKVDGVRY
jgi:branched-chain amino acid aminotransferase